MSDETTLLPCPFCGGEVELKEYKPNVSGVAICKECGARSPICKNDHTGGWKSKAIAVWNTRAELGNGTLTAEQVREAVEKHWHDLPDEYDMPEATALPEYSYDWQAIADELNAEVGGTCKLEKVKDYKQGIVITAWGTLCSECGAFYEFIDGRSWNCCPMCMRKAVKR